LVFVGCEKGLVRFGLNYSAVPFSSPHHKWLAWHATEGSFVIWEPHETAAIEANLSVHEISFLCQYKQIKQFKIPVFYNLEYSEPIDIGAENKQIIDRDNVSNFILL